MVDRVKEIFPASRVLVPELGMSIFSTKNPVEIIKLILGKINKYWNGRSEIILIGHSCGAVLARKVYLCACGMDKENNKEYGIQSELAWAPFVKRIILLAGMNRGWTVNFHLSFLQASAWELGIAIGKMMSWVGFEPLIFKFRRGAPFITQLRLQWLDLQILARDSSLGKAIVVQLLGSIDDLVSPEDNIDMVTGAKFFYLDIPASGHKNVILMDTSPHGILRYEIFRQSLLRSAEEMASSATPFFEPFIVQRPEVTDVVFVIHGIRDAGYWTQKVARKVQSLAIKSGRRVEMETSSYGYFPMLPFLLPHARKAKVEWLMDQYTENVARYPRAEFSYVGHSNGTYLLAKALKDYPACKFKNVVFAGSVVRSDYKWKDLFSSRRVKAAVNFVATRDWVVAIFPKAFELLRLSDLGSGGHDGFAEVEEGMQIKYVKGGHGSAIQENLWDSIAEFILNGKVPLLDEEISEGSQNSTVVFLGNIAPLVCLALLTLIIGVVIMLWIYGPDNDLLRIAICLVYLIFVWKVLTKL